MKDRVEWNVSRINAAHFAFENKLRQFLFLIYGKQYQ